MSLCSGQQSYQQKTAISLPELPGIFSFRAQSYQQKTAMQFAYYQLNGKRRYKHLHKSNLDSFDDLALSYMLLGLEWHD